MHLELDLMPANDPARVWVHLVRLDGCYNLRSCFEIGDNRWSDTQWWHQYSSQYQVFWLTTITIHHKQRHILPTEKPKHCPYYHYAFKIIDLFRILDAFTYEWVESFSPSFEHKIRGEAHLFEIKSVKISPNTN